jgi:hypothetical protein
MDAVSILDARDWPTEERSVSREDQDLGITERYVTYDRREPSPVLYFIHRLHGVLVCSCGWRNCGHKALVPTRQGSVA